MRVIAGYCGLLRSLRVIAGHCRLHSGCGPDGRCWWVCRTPSATTTRSTRSYCGSLRVIAGHCGPLRVIAGFCAHHRRLLQYGPSLRSRCFLMRHCGLLRCVDACCSLLPYCRIVTFIASYCGLLRLGCRVPSVTITPSTKLNTHCGLLRWIAAYCVGLRLIFACCSFMLIATLCRVLRLLRHTHTHTDYDTPARSREGWVHARTHANRPQ